MANVVKFYRGSETVYETKWKEEGHSGLEGALFFDSESKHIWYNGVKFGVNTNTDLGDYATQDWVDNKYGKAYVSLLTTNGSTSFTIGFVGVDGEASTTAISIPVVSDSLAGLMSPTDLTKLNETKTATATNAAAIESLGGRVDDVEEKLATIEEGAEVNDITEVRVDNTPLEIKTEGEIRSVNIALTETIKNVVGIQLGTVYVFMGSVTSVTDLDTIDNKVTGHVYNITDPFELNGKKYPAGTNVAYTNEGSWDALGGTIDLEPLESRLDAVEATDTSHGNRLDALEAALTWEELE